MPNQQICIQCHNTTFHFDRAKHAIVCDVCGWVQNTAEQTNEQLLYDQQRQKAIAYVKAKDYSSALPFLDRMRQMKPDDPDIYYLHMMGLSDCCQNLLLQPSDRETLNLFEHYWSIYSSLSSDQVVFTEYRRKRKLAFQDEIQKRIYQYLIMSLCSYFILLLSLCLLFNGSYWCIAMVIIAFVFIFKKQPLINLAKHIKTMKESQQKQ